MGGYVSLDEWETYVKTNAREDMDIPYAIIGINEEAGEIAGWYKKAVLRGNRAKLTDLDLYNEIGDVLYYLTRLAQLKGVTLNHCMDTCKAKNDARRSKR